MLGFKVNELGKGNSGMERQHGKVTSVFICPFPYIYTCLEGFIFIFL